MTARLASESPFPYGWPGRVCYFTVDAAFTPRQIRTRDELRQALDFALTDSVLIYATWPGQHRTDLFAIDRPELLADAIGHRRKATA